MLCAGILAAFTKLVKEEHTVVKGKGSPCGFCRKEQMIETWIYPETRDGKPSLQAVRPTPMKLNSKSFPSENSPLFPHLVF